MSSEERVKVELCAGTFSGCLVEGNAEQNARERKIKRRAMGISIVLQSVALAIFVIAPLFARPAELTGRNVVPIPPYSHHPAQQHAATAPANRNHIRSELFQPNFIPPTIPASGRDEPATQIEDIGLDIGRTGPINPIASLNMDDIRPQPPRPAENSHTQGRIRVSHIDPALLTRRIEPVFPPLAKQTRRSGKVQLHALIGADGSVQELQIVSGDPLFISSALDAVRQWHYQPTYLNGQPVEVDTFITVVYTLQ